MKKINKNENHEKGRRNDDKNINAKWNWNLFWIIQNTVEREIKKKQFLHPFPSHSIWDDYYHNIKTSLLSFSWLWLCLLSSFYYISYFFRAHNFLTVYIFPSPIPFRLCTKITIRFTLMCNSLQNVNVRTNLRRKNWILHLILCLSL